MKLNNEKPKHILIVDDDTFICDVLKEYARSMRCFTNIITAHDSDSALKKIRNQEFSVLLIDITLPKKSGLDLMKEIKKEELGDLSNVLGASGTLDADIINSAKSNGVQHFLAKPFNEAKFQEKVLKILTTPQAVAAKKKAK